MLLLPGSGWVTDMCCPRRPAIVKQASSPRAMPPRTSPTDGLGVKPIDAGASHGAATAAAAHKQHARRAARLGGMAALPPGALAGVRRADPKPATYADPPPHRAAVRSSLGIASPRHRSPRQSVRR